MDKVLVFIRSVDENIKLTQNMAEIWLMRKHTRVEISKEFKDVTEKLELL